MTHMKGNHRRMISKALLSHGVIENTYNTPTLLCRGAIKIKF